MARRSAFGITIDVSELEGLAERFAGLTPERIGALMVDAINDAADTAYALSRTRMLSGINLTDDYVKRKMQVDHATEGNPKATITAYGGRSFTTSLSHYGAMQLTRDVNWSNARITAAGNKFGAWPGWTKRKGNAALGIAADKKAAGKSVEVVRGRRKTMGPVFSIPGKKDNDGNTVLFRRKPGSDQIESLQGPSVYQLFRVASSQIEGEVTDELEQAIINVAEREFNKALT